MVIKVVLYSLSGFSVQWGLVRRPVNSNTGWCVANVAGNYNTSNPGNYGMFYLNGNNTSSNTNANIGSRLLVQWITILHRIILATWQKYHR